VDAVSRKRDCTLRAAGRHERSRDLRPAVEIRELIERKPLNRRRSHSTQNHRCQETELPGEFKPVVGTRKRFIPLPELLYSILQQLKHRKTSLAPDDFVLASRTGTPIYPDNIAARRLKWIGITLEIPWLSWHVFHRTRTKLMGEFGRHLNKELEKTLPLNPAVIPPPRGALKGDVRRKSKD
jgi:hypothetical protein